MRGERCAGVFTISDQSGSSPRAWGTLFVVDLDRRACRFIPTCVGNATHLYFPIRSFTVHPHVRGERWNERGEIDKTIRFIPTCVGNALWWIILEIV